MSSRARRKRQREARDARLRVIAYDEREAAAIERAINAPPRMVGLSQQVDRSDLLERFPLARIGSADVTFVPPVDPPSLFGINASSYDLWDETTYTIAEGPGVPWPLPKPGTKLRTWRVAGRVEVLQDSLRIAGLWPFTKALDWVACPGVFSMGMMLRAMRREANNTTRAYHQFLNDVAGSAMRVVDVNRDTNTITLTQAEGRHSVTLTNVSIEEPKAPQSRKPAFIPARRLDG